MARTRSACTRFREYHEGLARSIRAWVIWFIHANSLAPAPNMYSVQGELKLIYSAVNYTGLVIFFDLLLGISG